MKMNKKSRFAPIAIAISVIVGMFLGMFFSNRFTGSKLNIVNTTSNKINYLLHILDNQYVDTINVSDIVEATMPKILSELDPHSSYISAEDAKVANDDLKMSFSGVGVQFTIKNDTVYITNIIKGGPSEKVGLCAGDRIVSVDGKPYVGKVVTNNETLHRLKGDKGTKVKIGVIRHGEKKPLTFTIVRGDIPITSIDAAYMLTNSLGYIKVAKFSESTYAELLTALAKLQQEDFKGLVIDLRGNTGGYMMSAIQMVNEFLPADRLIVYTQGRKMPREDFKSDGRGSYQNIPLIVLTDETSASASEIFAGAIQDNDRGMIVGRRTFGKGLVQQPIPFSDGSLIHLTIARYYTPSGRCIQKPYTGGDIQDYEMDIVRRYQRGEFFNEDSIRQSGEKFKTSIGREVYGGGGIVPDVFVAEDTTAFTSYYQEVATQGLINQFCFEYSDSHRKELESLGDADKVVDHLKNNHVIEKFIRFCDSKGIKRRNNMILQSRKLFEDVIFGAIIYNIMDIEEYVKYFNHDDITIQRAIKLYKDGETKPKLN
ncbi:MAG: S41 family peptidase [Prevotellaceae bacterium]|nr:S41 family peptidase [Candidatus Colivivens equi]